MCGAIRFANWGLNERAGDMFIKNFVGAQLPFPFFLAFLHPPSLSSFISTSSSGHGKDSGGALNLLASPGVARPPNDI